MRLKTFFIAFLLLSAATAACDNKGGEADTSDVSVFKDAQPSPDEQESDQADQKAAGEPDRGRKTATSPGGGVLAEDPPLNIGVFLSKQHVEAVAPDGVSEAPLAGGEPSPNYNAIQYRGDDPDRLGVGVQMWKLKNVEEARARIDNLQEQYLNVDSAPDSIPVEGAMAFVSERAGILTLVFAAGGEAQGYVAAISCDEETCPEGLDQISELANRMLERMKSAGNPKPKAKR